MTTFGLRFDFRNPSFNQTSMADRYQAALDMAEWADRLDFAILLLSEHHGSDDGYLPSPITMAAAMAARTSRLRIQIAALVAPFYDALRLAEDISVLDNLSAGRVEIVIGSGYVDSEFDMFGKNRSQRVQALTETVETLRKAFSGEPFDFRGRTVTITPPPLQPGGPPILLGGTSEAAARRAARLGDGFVPTSAALWDVYRKELAALGKSDPGPQSRGGPTFIHLAEDPTGAWDRILPHALHEVNAYGRWLATAGIGSAGGYVPVTDPQMLIASGQYRVITPIELVEQLKADRSGFLVLHPLMGGIPPELGWESLRLFENDVLPRLADNA
jgi:alkanesulfonate monooxygenase SsuD/methylene tetrahydromethanopterin reductase-like flavin-dependent oxidoreductase (luciferase family)